MFFRGLLTLVAALSLGACGSLPSLSGLPAPPGLSSPASIATQTSLDERALIGVELSYKAARTVAQEAADAGLVDSDSAAKLAVLDNQLFGVLWRARAAYETANAKSYGVAIAEASPLVSEIWALVAGTRKASYVR